MPVRRARRSWGVLLVPILASVLATGLVACGGSAGDDLAPSAPVDPSAPVTPEPAPETRQSPIAPPDPPPPELPAAPGAPTAPTLALDAEPPASVAPPPPLDRDPVHEPTPDPDPAPVPPPPPDPLSDRLPAAAPTVPAAAPPPDPFIAIHVASGRACAYTETGETFCWDSSGQRWDYPRGSGTPCWISPVGEMTCLHAELGQAQALAESGPYTAFSTRFGPDHGCGLTPTGAAHCWGWFAAILGSPPAEQFTTISVGRSGRKGGHWSACGLTVDGAVVCWQAKQGYHGEITERQITRAPGNYLQVQADGDGFCALTADGAVLNRQGDPCFPTVDASGQAVHYTTFSQSAQHACALTAAGAAVCQWLPPAFASRAAIPWDSGVLARLIPPDPAPGRYTAISVDGGYACALTEAGEAVCWLEQKTEIAQPDPPPGGYIAFSDGYGHTCALAASGEATCWGWNNFGQAEVPPGRYRAISAGHAGTCAITDTGAARCWGVAEDLPPGHYRAIGTGLLETCGLTTAGEAVCSSGHFTLGVWGDAGAAFINVPPGPFATISVGPGFHACALTAVGEAVCWGANGRGQTEVPPGRYRAISVGVEHTCAITDTGKAICWGEYHFASPVGKPTYTALSTTRVGACFLTEQGTVQCLAPPFLLAGLQYPLPPGRFTALSVSAHQLCALTEAGSIVCQELLTEKEGPAERRAPERPPLLDG